MNLHKSQVQAAVHLPGLTNREGISSAMVALTGSSVASEAVLGRSGNVLELHPTESKGLQLMRSWGLLMFIPSRWVLVMVIGMHIQVCESCQKLPSVLSLTLKPRGYGDEWPAMDSRLTSFETGLVTPTVSDDSIFQPKSLNLGGRHWESAVRSQEIARLSMRLWSVKKESTENLSRRRYHVS